MRTARPRFVQQRTCRRLFRIRREGSRVSADDPKVPPRYDDSVERLPAARRLLQRTRLVPWRVEVISSDMNAITEELRRLREDLDASSQVFADSIMLLKRSLDDISERVADMADRRNPAS